MRRLTGLGKTVLILLGAALLGLIYGWFLSRRIL